MKINNKMSRTVGTLEKAFRVLNSTYFENQLPTPIITVSPSSKSYAHFMGGGWNVVENGEKIVKCEINISSAYLSEGTDNLGRPRDLFSVCASLQHELIHEYCWCTRNGIIEHEPIFETSRQNTYHNKYYRDEAEKRGLIISYSKTIGWSITDYTEEFMKIIMDANIEDIMMNRSEYTLNSITVGRNGKNTIDRTTRRSNMVKLICPKCGQIARTTCPNHNIICGNCIERMIEA